MFKVLLAIILAAAIAGSLWNFICKKIELPKIESAYGEYSGWFYISCPVIWKSLFRSVFVHTES